jgi:hypothetical protein
VVEVHLDYFVGRRDAYALQQPDGSYIAIRKPLTREELEQHARGKITVATYLVTPDGKARAGVYDFDQRDDRVRHCLKWLRRFFEHMGLRLYIEASGHKGYHAWVLLGEFIPAWKVINLLRTAWQRYEEEVGGGLRVEIFPKQASPGDLGNCIKLPWGIHRKSRKWATLLGEDFMPLPDWGISQVKPLEEPAEDLVDRILDEYPLRQEATVPQPSSQGAAPRQGGFVAFPPCYFKMEEGVPEGARHIASFRLAVMMFRGHVEQQKAQAKLLQWDAERNKPPLGDKHILQNVKDAYTGKYSLGCPDIEAAGYCSPDCPIYKKRWHEHDRRTRARPSDSISIKSITKVGTNPPYYRCRLNGGEIILTLPELMTQSKFKRKVAETFNIIPNIGMKQVEWEIQVNELLAEMDYESAAADATDQSRYMDLIWQWLETTTPAQSKTDVEAGRPVEKEESYFFRARDVQEFLKKRFGLNIERSELWMLIRQAGGSGQVSVRVGDSVLKLWALPKRRQEPEEPKPTSNDEPEEDLEF